MVVAKLNIVRVSFLPAKAYAPLVVHADTMLTFPIASQCFQAIARRDTQEVEARGAVDQIQLTLRSYRHVARHSLDELPREKRGSSLVGKRLDHEDSVLHCASYVKRN